jgi:hypothetical protein
VCPDEILSGRTSELPARKAFFRAQEKCCQNTITEQIRIDSTEDAMYTTETKTTQSKNNLISTNYYSTTVRGVFRKARRSAVHLIVIAALGAFALAQQPSQNGAAQNNSGQNYGSPNSGAPAAGTARRGGTRTSVAREIATVTQREAGPQKLPLRRVVLYKSGVGYFEHIGKVSGNEDVEIDLTSSQLNDVLKSLTALDMNGGRIVGASYNSQEPAGHQLEQLPVPVANKTTLSDLLQALRGARVEVHASGATVTGRVLGVERVKRPSGNLMVEVDRLNLIGEYGEVRQVMLEQGTSVRFTDRELEKQLERAMGLLDASHQEDTRRLILSTAGTGERTVRVSYISEVPVWKTTYRIVLPERAADKPLLQGWAVVDNTVGEDWENVELSLASGAPQSFIQDLSQPLYLRRPMVGLPQAYQLTPQLHGSTLVPGPSRLVGGVVDPDGKPVVGANVRVLASSGHQVATGRSGGNGVYLFEGLTQGTYQLEISANGFKSLKFSSVRVLEGNVSRYDGKLEIGATAMTVSVEAGAGQVLETMNTSVQNTITGRAISNLPVNSRSSTFEGLPKGAMNITFDGINLQDNLLRSSDGFLGINDPRINDVNEFGIMTNGNDPSRAGSGAVQMNYVSRAGAMERSVNAGTVGLLGDMFEYRVRDRVTIRKNQSALVPIAQTEIQADKVALWNASLGMARPLRALWLKNTSDLVLDSGTFNVIEDGAFAGEGLIATRHPGERRLISYAADLAMQIVQKHEPGLPKVTRVRVANGELVKTVEQREKTIYTIRNEDTQARVVVIEHPIRNDWKLIEEQKPEEKTADVYRFRVEVAAKETKDFSIEEMKPDDDKTDLKQFDQDDLDSLAKDHSLTPELEKALKDLIAQSDAIDEMNDEIKDKNGDVEQVFKDQGRLRENMRALKGTAEEKALLQRYTKELDEEESQLARLRKEIAELEAKKKQAQEDMNKTIEKMAFDVKM